MSEQNQQDESPVPATLASAADLSTLDLEVVLGGLNRADDYALEQALHKAAKDAEARGDAAAERGYRLLCILCTFHLRVEDQGQVWGPQWQGPDGRSYIASDFRGEQTGILANFVASIKHPALRARVADVVWYNDRTQSAIASLAVDAYCEMINHRLDGSWVRRFKDLENSILDLVDWFHRALQIAAISRRRSGLPEVLRRTFLALYVQAEATGQYVAYVKIARLGLEYDFVDWAKVAPDAERLADRRAGGDYPMAIQEAWNLAARAYAKLGEDESRRRCQGRSVDETLRMREQVGSAAAQAFWTRKAIGELRNAGGFQDRIAKLRAELRDLQDASLDEFGQFSIPVDLTEQRQATIEVFEELSLADTLLQFALLSRSPQVDELRDQALQSRKNGFISSLFGASHSDHEGKTMLRAPRCLWRASPAKIGLRSSRSNTSIFGVTRSWAASLNQHAEARCFVFP